MSMVLATTWVRRGVPAPFPKKYEIDEAELNRISDLARLQLEDAQDDLEDSQFSKVKGGAKENDADAEDDDEDGGVEVSHEPRSREDEDLKMYNLDDYDNEPLDDDGQKFSMFGNVKSLAYHAPNEEDPYLVMPEAEREDEEREELQILADDNLLLAAKVEDEVAHLEVMVYEDEADNLYVHHDIMLPGVPLCVEWLDFPVGKNAEGKTKGSFVAVATMRPEIEIWDLDVVDSMYPNAILGQESTGRREELNGLNSRIGGKKEKTRKKLKANDQYHIDAVLSLAANRSHRNLLASASADKTVKLWDLSTEKCAKSYSMHQDKVCSLDWHPKETTSLLSGGYDCAAIWTDMRAPDAKAPRWNVDADVEQVRWNVHDSNFIYVTTETGMVYYFDTRTTASSNVISKSIWTLQAHDGATSSFDINPSVPDFLATGSDDKQVKLWNVKDLRPSMVVARNLGVGRVFSSEFAPDPEVGFRLAVAGSKGAVQIWDTSTNAAVRQAFAHRLPAHSKDSEGKERIVGVDNAGSDVDEDDDGEGERAEEWESMEE